jgi:hypothetical protein
MNAQPNIVLFHAAWPDGYRWGGVIERRQQPLATSAFGDVIGVPAGETRRPDARVVATTVEIRSATSRWSPTRVTWPSSSNRRAEAAPATS